LNVRRALLFAILVATALGCLRPPARVDSAQPPPPAQPLPDSDTTKLPPRDSSPSSRPPLSLVIAKATTTAAGSVPATCLLDPACTGTWAPAAVDSGTVELADRVTSPREGVAPIALPDDRGGANSERDDVVTRDGGRTWVGRCYGHDNVRVQMTGSAHVEIRAVRFLDDEGKRIRVDVPRLVNARVTTTAIMEPDVAYQPAFLFDARRSFAWAFRADALAEQAAPVVVTVELDAPLTVSGVRVWNGDQRSPTHLVAHGRPTALRVRAGDEERPVSLDKRAREETVTFAPITAKRFDIVVDAVERGGDVGGARGGIPASEPLAEVIAMSELRFLDGDGRIVHPIVVATIPRADAALTPMLDVGYVGVVGDVVTPPATFTCVERRLRISSTSAFSAVTAIGPRFLEGAWAPVDATTVRAFGVWHTVGAGEGGGDSDVMFDRKVRVQVFAALDEAERVRVAGAVWRQLRDGSGDAVARTRDGKEIARSPETLAAALAAMPGALAVTTPLFTDVMLPAEDLPFFCE
jgi:hypothetical protein